MKTSILLLVVALFSCQPSARGAASELPWCEWCGADEAPGELSWETTIAGPEEPGERLVIAGTVYDPDGRTPAAGVILYMYHTNSEGIYPKRGDEKGNARRHGYLRSWLRTNEQGRYRITTIRPGTYPTRSDPAHIHMTVKEPDAEEYWIDSIVFEGDPLIEGKAFENRGGSGVVHLTQDEEGVWRGRRDIVLER